MSVEHITLFSFTTKEPIVTEKHVPCEDEEHNSNEGGLAAKIDSYRKHLYESISLKTKTYTHNIKDAL
jgi:hypothetical protein